MDIVEFLWSVAGVAMLLFTLFLAVLIVAGIVFRRGPRRLRQRSSVVFGMSTVLVVASTAAIALPSSFDNVTSSAIKEPNSVAADRQLVGMTTAATGAAVPNADGSTSGSGLPHTSARSLVLYDTSGPQPETEELYATLLSNLVSHFGSWTARPVGRYRSGEMADYDATFYLGEPSGTTALPSAFLTDVARGKSSVVWINGDIEQLRVQTTTAGSSRKYGFTPQGFETTRLVQLNYQGASLPMDPESAADGFTRIGIDDPKKATVLATAVPADGGTVPWAVRSGKLTYLSENPLASQNYLESRNIVFSDLLLEALGSSTRPRHRALVRLEDVNPTTEPDDLREITDYLADQGVPFSIGIYPVFRDPNDTSAGPDGVTIRLSERPELVAALRYAMTRGGSLVAHGLTHQYGTKNNPLDGGSGDDTEFYLCHFDEQQQLQLDGPVPEDSQEWALGRMDAAIAELKTAGLPKPSTWEFSHYLASAVDYLAAGKRFDRRYERTLYFPGILTGQPVDHSYPFGQLLPYPVRDVYGTTVIPENLGYVEGEGDSITGMLDAARDNLVVRDGVASFFYHPYLGLGELPRMVEGLQDMGYSFVSTADLVGSS